TRISSSDKFIGISIMHYWQRFCKDAYSFFNAQNYTEQSISDCNHKNTKACEEYEGCGLYFYWTRL
ncbi:MAG: hypothetical protein LBP25_00670, partial [Tannerellaceae bacterium]|nr:hypothetical protein [Tannerellaceae bacterium]